MQQRLAEDLALAEEPLVPQHEAAAVRPSRRPDVAGDRLPVSAEHRVEVPVDARRAAEVALALAHRVPLDELLRRRRRVAAPHDALLCSRPFPSHCFGFLLISMLNALRASFFAAATSRL